MPREYVAYRGIVRLAAQAHVPARWPLDAEYEVILEYSLGSRRSGYPSTATLDVDNILGTVMDALERVVWSNDRQVVSARVERASGGAARAHVTVRALSNGGEK